jgi:glycosyltransferase involved in cell wall biosynthesis
VATLTDIVLISLATTPGLVRSDAAFAQLIRDCGVECDVVPVEIGASGKLRRHPAATDLVEAIAARRTARKGAKNARAVVYSTTTAALLAPTDRPYAVRFDATAGLNRPAGWPSAWQRARERRVLKKARLLLPVSGGAAGELPYPHAPVVRLPIPVDDVPTSSERDIAATAYAGYPRKRGLELICAAWRPGQRLVVGGTDRDKALRWLERAGVPEPEDVEWAGMVPREEWLRTVARSRLFVNASRWEDYGVAQFEALAAGTPVVTVPSPGPYEALPLIRDLDPELVTEKVDARQLAKAIEKALAYDDARRAGYAARAQKLLEPYRADALRDTVRERVLPVLLGEAPR